MGNCHKSNPTKITNRVKKDVINIVVVGSSKIGKTHLIKNILGETYIEYIRTTGIKTYSHKIVNQKINVIDTPSDKQYDDWILIMIERSDICIFIHDSSNSRTYDLIQKFIIHTTEKQQCIIVDNNLGEIIAESENQCSNNNIHLIKYHDFNNLFMKMIE